MRSNLFLSDKTTMGEESVFKPIFNLGKRKSVSLFIDQHGSKMAFQEFWQGI